MDDEALRKEILSRFPENAILEVRFLRHGDRATIEPREMVVELVPRGPDEYNADPSEAPEDVAQQVVNAFLGAHDAVIRRLLDDLPGLLGPEGPAAGQRQIIGMRYGRGGAQLTTVVARGDPKREDERLRQELLKRFPDGALLEVRIEHHEDRPNLIEPGELHITLVPRGPEEFNADPRTAPEEVGREVVQRFLETHHTAIQQLRRDVHELGGRERVRLLGLRYGRGGLGIGGEPLPPAERGLVPVMVRLGQADLETLDKLITAGLAASRAEAVRWCLARIRERPAYRELGAAVERLAQLKAEF